MKRLAPLFLLVLFLYNIVGYYAIFLFEQHEAKEAAEQRLRNSIPEKDLTLIVLSRVELESSWINSFLGEEGEIFHNGKMYDIVNKKDVGGLIYFYCINDAQEDYLLAGLAKHVDDDINPNSLPKSDGNKTSKKVQKDYFSDSFFFPSVLVFDAIKCVAADPKIIYATAFKDVAVPPPRLV